MRYQTWSLTGLDVDDLVTEADILSRRPSLCTVCGGTFTVEQFRRVRHRTRVTGEPNPFVSDRQTQEVCPN